MRALIMALVLASGCGVDGVPADEANAAWPANSVTIGGTCGASNGFCASFDGWCHDGACRQFCSPVAWPRCPPPTATVTFTGGGGAICVCR